MDDVISECEREAVGMERFVLIKRPVFVRWFLTAFIALLLAGQCAAMLMLEVNMASMKLKFVYGLYFDGFPFLALAVLLYYGLVAGLISALLVIYVSPKAASSGIPDTKAFLNGNHIPGFLASRTWFARTLALLLVTSAGLFAGSEGPLIAHLGAIIASGVARGRLTLCGRRWRAPWNFSGYKAQCEFVSLGTAMGVAGAFSSPIGGVLWSFEEASSYWPTELTWRAFFGCALCSFMAKVLKSGFGRDFQRSVLMEFPDKHPRYQTWELLFFALVGVLSGLLGALFCLMSAIIGKMRQRVFTKKTPRNKLRIFEVLLATTLILLTCSGMPFLLGCQDLESLSETSSGPSTALVQGHCPDGQYSDMATLVMQPKQAAIKALFSNSFQGGARLSNLSLCIAYIIIFLGTLITSGMAMPFGLFVPHIMAGACLGRVIGQSVQLFFPTASINPGIYALVGAGGQLAGISRITVSLTMILVEVTGNMRLIMPLLLCIACSKGVADCIVPSVFDIAVLLNKQIRMIDSEWPGGGSIQAGDICCREVVVLHGIETFSTVMRVLSETPFQNFPVVEGIRAHVIGMISRPKLLHAVKVLRQETLSGTDYTSEVMDLMAYADVSPEVKHFKTPISRVMRHFGAMGLQILCVVDNQRGLLGVVTRTDVARLVSIVGRKNYACWSGDAEVAAADFRKRFQSGPPKGVPSICLLSEQFGRLMSGSRADSSDNSSEDDDTPSSGSDAGGRSDFKEARGGSNSKCSSTSRSRIKSTARSQSQVSIGSANQGRETAEGSDRPESDQDEVKEGPAARISMCEPRSPGPQHVTFDLPDDAGSDMLQELEQPLPGLAAVAEEDGEDQEFVQEEHQDGQLEDQQLAQAASPASSNLQLVVPSSAPVVPATSAMLMRVDAPTQVMEAAMLVARAAGAVAAAQAAAALAAEATIAAEAATALALVASGEASAVSRADPGAIAFEAAPTVTTSEIASAAFALEDSKALPAPSSEAAAVPTSACTERALLQEQIRQLCSYVDRRRKPPNSGSGDDAEDSIVAHYEQVIHDLQKRLQELN
eukprot:TRINITY_DN89872_c0_g1_i1.p1 TRINITY_DN89872_c0_g1~~TRINITY_DN89872_c0_g1_i1.p1  ORF type:complete len:1172 (-),score=171.86 TRINITY_DN89872_c0_g1_i1:215-3379(-)